MASQDSILVTGGAGFIGSHTVKALLKKGRKVVVLDVMNTEATSFAEKKMNLQHLRKVEAQCGGKLVIVQGGDICNTQLVRDVVQENNVTQCVHLAARAYDRRSVEFAKQYIEHNITGTFCLFEALAEAGVKKVVVASTRSVYGERSDPSEALEETSQCLPVNPYGFSKVATEGIAHYFSHKRSMQVIVFRLSSIYGPRGRPDMLARLLIERIHCGMSIDIYGEGTGSRTWLFVKDVVDAVQLGLEHLKTLPEVRHYDVFNLSTEKTTTNMEMVELAAKVVGKKAEIVMKPAQPGDAHHVGCLDSSKAKRVLGWEPKVDVEQGLKMIYEDYLCNPTVPYQQGHSNHAELAAPTGTAGKADAAGMDLEVKPKYLQLPTPPTSPGASARTHRTSSSSTGWSLTSEEARVRQLSWSLPDGPEANH